MAPVGVAGGVCSASLFESIMSTLCKPVSVFTISVTLAWLSILPSSRCLVTPNSCLKSEIYIS